MWKMYTMENQDFSLLSLKHRWQHLSGSYKMVFFYLDFFLVVALKSIKNYDSFIIFYLENDQIT